MARMCPTLAVSQSKPSSSSITPQYIRLSYIHSSGARANKYLDLVANVVGVLLQSKSSNEPQGPVAQLGARFHGMEEVDGSNPSRSTKVFKYLPLYPLQIQFCGVQTGVQNSCDRNGLFCMLVFALKTSAALSPCKKPDKHPTFGT